MVKELLLIDDDMASAVAAEQAFASMGFTIRYSPDLQSALQMLRATDQIVLLKMSMPQSSGLDVLLSVRSVYPDSTVIALCAHGDSHAAILRAGAFACLNVPTDVEELKVVVEKAAQDMAQRLELSRLRALHGTRDLNPLTGKSKKMAKVLKDMEREASNQGATLIEGECGTGKEFIARAIHNLGSRRDGPFVSVNTTTTPGELLDAMLFGELNDPLRQRHTPVVCGRLARTNGGTIFIDEVSNFDLALQQRLLSFIRTGQYIPVGGTSAVVADVRVIAATSKDIKGAVTEATFNPELYDLLHRHEIKLPPLRERKEDILPIAEHFLESSRRKYDTDIKEFSDAAKSLMLSYRWPGNVSELKRTVFRAAAVSEGAMIDDKDLLVTEERPCSMHDFLKDKLSKYLKDITQLNDGNLYNTIIAEVEKSLISIVLAETNGNQLKASRALGINRNTLRAKLKQYQISISDTKKEHNEDSSPQLQHAGAMTPMNP
ncbi:MAG: sigma-54-dependent Fis family transcriptional regulator [Nitrospirae bacterium]|uniref:sigma-54-dependent transcriptional regulator n=1 Tax=Candidatus Magnetobacterium casense TaxID=1455061 RepID=UPI000696D917|nr:sigma-54 dependent transcriptional regulator [Candidatus Magnetobacterium casensis]MBF0336407.1 sigma-54-dependent Fis family transcriptional regulator [Nitrospirota bacterium]